MDLAALTGQLGAQPATAGWDAVCAISVANINQLFQAWYLQNGPTNPETPIQLVFQGGSSWYLLDAILGPPEISFSAGSGLQEGQISMIIVSGALVCFGISPPTVQSALVLQPDVASVTGTVDFSKGSGKAALGEVVLNLGAGAYTPVISGVEKGSLAATALGQALAAYFAATATSYRLGGVTTASVPAALQPTAFEMVVQPNPQQAGDGCVLLLIQTNGAPGTVGALAAYPIPDGSTAALVVSNKVVFNELLPAQLTNATTGVTFAGSPSGLVYATAVNAGSVDLGVLSYENAPGEPYSSNGKFQHLWSTGHESADVVISFVGLTLAPGGGSGSDQLAARYSSTWQQGWAYIGQSGFGPSFPGDSYETAETTLTWDATATPTIAQPSTCVVTFPWSGPPGCTSQLNENLLGGFGQVDPSTLIEQDVTASMAGVFTAMTVADVDTFALQNLLFYPNQSLVLPTGALPCDLLLTGSTAPELTVSPASVSVAPGQPPVQFTAALTGGGTAAPVWEISPQIGSISSAGLYTPPAEVPVPKVVTVSATTGNSAGSALIVLFAPLPSSGLVVGPQTITLTPGATYDFTVTDSAGQPVNVSWAITPATGGGSITETFGVWQYTAPTPVTSPLTITLTATNTADSSQYATAAVTVVPAATLSLTPASSTLTPGQTVALSVQAPASIPAVTWLLYPSTGAGTITPAGVGMQATYQAPASVTGPLDVQVVAYAVGGAAQAAGIGYASITVNQT